MYTHKGSNSMGVPLYVRHNEEKGHLLEWPLIKRNVLRNSRGGGGGSKKCWSIAFHGMPFLRLIKMKWHLNEENHSTELIIQICTLIVHFFCQLKELILLPVILFNSKERWRPVKGRNDAVSLQKTYLSAYLPFCCCISKLCRVYHTKQPYLALLWQCQVHNTLPLIVSELWKTHSLQPVEPG